MSKTIIPISPSVNGNHDAPVAILNDQQRVDLFLQALEETSVKYGVRLGISDTITNLPKGAFQYTPPEIVPILVKDWAGEG